MAQSASLPPSSLALTQVRVVHRPFTNMRHYVLDAESLAPVPVGVPGELFISGPGVARGYLGRPDLTAAAFLPNPFMLPSDNGSYARMYRTGDNVMWLPSGIQR